MKAPGKRHIVELILLGQPLQALAARVKVWAEVTDHQSEWDRTAAAGGGQTEHTCTIEVSRVPIPVDSVRAFRVFGRVYNIQSRTTDGALWGSSELSGGPCVLTGVSTS